MTDALADELERLGKETDGEGLTADDVVLLADLVLDNLPAILSALREREPTDSEFFDAVVGWLSARDMIDRQDALDGLTVADVIAALDEHENGMATALREREPVAWRVKDFADGWILYHTEAQARREAYGAGNLVQPLYTAPAPQEEQS